MKILCTTAMASEYSLAKQALLKVKGSNTIHVVKTGVGIINAASELTNWLCTKDSYDLVANIGFAASTKNLNKGDIVFPKEVYNANAVSLKETEGEFEYNKFYSLDGNDYTDYKLLTTDTFITCDSLKSLCKKFNLKSCVFDMEGAAIAQVADSFGLPLVIIKMISDRPEVDSFEDFQKFIESDIDFCSMMSYLSLIDSCSY